MGYIHNIFASFDIFSFPVYLNVNKQNSFKSWIGGCGTILMVVCFFLYFWQRFAQFIFMEKVFTLEDEEYNTSPKEIIFGKENFMFAVNIEHDDYNEDYRGDVFFDISLFQKHRIHGKKVTGKNNQQRKIDLEECSKSHFQDITGMKQEVLDDMFERDDFSKWLCPPKDISLKIGGVYTSEEFLYLQLVVTVCDKNPLNTNCKTLKEEDMNKRYKFQFYHTNFIVNKNANDRVPVITYISDFLFFQFKPNKLISWSDIFFREYNITTQDNVWGYTEPVKLSYPVFIQGEQREATENLTPQDIDDGEGEPLEYIVMNIRRSPFTSKVERSYEKIDQFLAYVGGFVATLMGVFAGFITFFKKPHYQIDLANQMFQFQRKQEQKNEEENEQEVIEMKESKKLTRNQYIQRELAIYFSVHKPVVMTFKYYISMLFCKKCFYGEEEKLIDTAIQKVDQAIDLKAIIHNQLLNQKGVDVSLGKKQRVLLDLIPKPDLSVDNFQEDVGLLDKIKSLKGKSSKELFKQHQEYQDEFLSTKKIDTLYSAYKKAKEDDQKDPEQKRLNKRIIKQISSVDPSLLNIFDKAYKKEQNKQFSSKVQVNEEPIKEEDIKLEERKNQDGEDGEKKKKYGCF